MTILGPRNETARVRKYFLKTSPCIGFVICQHNGMIRQQAIQDQQDIDVVRGEYKCLKTDARPCIL